MSAYGTCRDHLCATLKQQSHDMSFPHSSHNVSLKITSKICLGAFSKVVFHRCLHCFSCQKCVVVCVCVWFLLHNKLRIFLYCFSLYSIFIIKINLFQYYRSYIHHFMSIFKVIFILKLEIYLGFILV